MGIEQTIDTELKVKRHLYLTKYGVLAFEFEHRAVLYWGFGPAPGTDLYGYRFVMSHRFKDRSEYLAGRRVAHRYVRDLGLGFSGVHDLYKSFNL